MSFKKKLKKYSILLLGFSSLPMLTACYGDFYDESYNEYEDFCEHCSAQEQVEGEGEGEENAAMPEGASTEAE
jgi:hypothetical protein